MCSLITVYVLLDQVSSRTPMMAVCMSSVESTRKAWWYGVLWLHICVIFLCFLNKKQNSWPLCVDESAEAAFYHPWAGAVSSLQELWWDTLYRSETVREMVRTADKYSFVTVCETDNWIFDRPHCCLLIILLCIHAGKKQDVWFVVDPETGEKQTSLTTSSSNSICPNSPLLYIGRTGTSAQVAASVRVRLSAEASC